MVPFRTDTHSDPDNDSLVIVENPSTMDPISIDPSNVEVRTTRVTFAANIVSGYQSAPNDSSIQQSGTKSKRTHFQSLRKRFRSPSTSGNDSSGDASDTSEDTEVAKYHKRIKDGKPNFDSTVDSSDKSQYPKYFDKAVAGMNPPADDISSISVTPTSPPPNSTPSYVPNRYKQAARTPSPSQDIRTRTDSSGNIKPLGVDNSNPTVGMGRGQYFNRGVSGTSSYNVGSPRVSRTTYRATSRDRSGRAPSTDRNARTGRAPSTDRHARAGRSPSVGRNTRTGRAPSYDRNRRDRSSRATSTDRGQFNDYRASGTSQRYDRSLPTSDFKYKLRARTDSNPIQKHSTNVKQYHNA